MIYELVPLPSLTMAAAGLAFGLIYFAALRRAVDLFVTGGGRLIRSALMLARFGTAAVLFTSAVKVGPLPLLASFLGFLLARKIALRGVRRAW
jgi:hypothetical protein